MSAEIKLADARFLLPELPTRFAAAELDPAHHEAWAAIAEEVAPDDVRLASSGVIVGGPGALDRLTSSGAAQVLVYGDCARPLRRAGYPTTRWLLVGEELLEGYVPLHDRRIGRRAIKKWRRPASVSRRIAARLLVESGQVPADGRW